MYSSSNFGEMARMFDTVLASQNRLSIDSRVKREKSIRWERVSIPRAGKVARSAERDNSRDERFGAVGSRGRSRCVNEGCIGVRCGEAKESEKAVRLGMSGALDRSAKPCVRE